MRLPIISPVISWFQGRSLRQEFRRSLLTLFIIMVLVYSLGLMFYFIAGLDTGKRLEMKNMAIKYAALAKQDDSIAPNSTITRSLIVSDSYEGLPKEFRDIFEKEDLIPGELEVEPLEDEDSDPVYVYFVYVEPTKDGKLIYLADKLWVPEEDFMFTTLGFLDLEIIVFAAAGLSVLLFVFVFHVLTGRVNRRIGALQAWADQLRARDPVEQRPDFKYKELNKIADHLSNSINRIAGFVEREHAFLRHASHELRTPITIISGNSALLEKMMHDARQMEINNRIQRASHSMQTIVATLLWLGREKEAHPELQEVNLSDMIERCIEDHRYLLGGKEIELSVDLREGSQTLPAAPLEIILANIVRNAFQHTQAGQIKVRADEQMIMVSNTDHITPSRSEGVIFEQDKGIGLSLIRRMAERLGWRFELTSSDQTVTASLKLRKYS